MPAEQPRPTPEPTPEPTVRPAPRRRRRTRSASPGTITKVGTADRAGIAKWKIRAYAGRDPDGTPRYVYGAQVLGTRRDAERALDALIDTVAGSRATNVDGIRPAMTMDELWVQYE